MKWLPIGVAMVAVLGIAGCADDDGGDIETREFISVANKKAEFFTGASIGDRLGFQEELRRTATASERRATPARRIPARAARTTTAT